MWNFLKMSKPIDVLMVTGLFIAGGLVAAAYSGTQVISLINTGDADISALVSSAILFLGFVSGAVIFYVYTPDLSYSDTATGVVEVVTENMESVSANMEYQRSDDDTRRSEE